MRRIVSTLAAILMAGSILAPAANAQDVFDGGRFGGGSSQLIPEGVPVPGGELKEIDEKVDLDRYAGKWYQVAALPQPYTLQCASNTTAEYAKINDNTISVKNTCRTLTGESSVIEGTAKVRSDASLRVNFPRVPFQNQNGATNYRVTYLEDDYSLAIVGDPNRLSGFVLSRTPNLTNSQWKKVSNTISARGWWSCAFITNPMNGGRSDYKPLCTF